MDHGSGAAITEAETERPAAGLLRAGRGPLVPTGVRRGARQSERSFSESFTVMSPWY